MVELLRRVFNPERRVKLAMFGLIGSLIAWPLTAVTVFASEPPGILGLSWASFIVQMLILVVTTDVRREQDEDG